MATKTENHTPQIGDKLKWLTIAEGKIQIMSGEVKDIVGDTMRLKGTNAIGHTYSDLVGISDKSITWL